MKGYVTRSPFRLSREQPRQGTLNYHSLISKAREYVSCAFHPVVIVRSVRSESVRFVCLLAEFSRFAFRFNPASDVENDLGVDIEAAFVVPAAALAVIPITSSQEPEHMEVREVVLNALECREWVHGVRIRYALVSGLDRLRTGRRRSPFVEGRERFEQQLGVLGLIEDSVA